MSADSIPDRGRAERLCDLPISNVCEDAFGIDSRGLRGVHIWDDRRDSHRRVEQPKQREARQINLTRLDPVEVAEQIDLSIEHAMLVDDSLRRAGAATGEDDGGGGEEFRVPSSEFRVLGRSAFALLDEARVCRSSPHPSASADGDVESCVAKAAAIQNSNRLHDRDRDEAIGVDLFQASKNIRAAHAGIDQHDDDAGSHQAEGQRDELETWPDHQHQALTGLHAPGQQPVGDRGCFVFELRERPSSITVLPGRITPSGLHNGDLIRPARGRGG